MNYTPIYIIKHIIITIIKKLTKKKKNIHTTTEVSMITNWWE